MSTSVETIQISHVWADEPNAIKLRSETMILPMGEARDFKRNDPSVNFPLAKKLFSLVGVEEIRLDTYTVTAIMDEDEDWEELGEKIERLVKEHIAETPPLEKEAAQEKPKGKFSFGFKVVEGRPREEQMKIVQELFEKEVNPSIQSHGGAFTLVDIRDNNVYVQLGGGCQGCGMATVTLKQGVEGRLREVLPEMDQLIDTTDHESGDNPYYQPNQ